MIVTKFGLREEPFRDSLDERFYYSSPKHERAFASMVYCIANHEPGGIILGESGLGKSLIGKKVLSTLAEAEEYLLAFILVNPQMPKTSLLRQILKELGIEMKGANTQELLETLHYFVIEKYEQGIRVVLILDESHFLAVSSLHLARTLTNLETPREKLLTIIFIAEDRFLERLQHPTYSSLRGRIKVKAHLEPLKRDETEEYINHRLRIAGSDGNIFTPEARQLIHQHSRGICRLINKIASQALFCAAFDDGTEVNERAVREALSDLEGIL